MLNYITLTEYNFYKEKRKPVHINIDSIDCVKTSETTTLGTVIFKGIYVDVVESEAEVMQIIKDWYDARQIDWFYTKGRNKIRNFDDKKVV